MREIARDSRGNTLLVEDNEVGGRRYWSDEIGGGVMVWDTSLVSPEMLRLALRHEHPQIAADLPVITPEMLDEWAKSGKIER